MMTPFFRYVLGVVLLGFIVSCPVFGEVYRWKDANGKYIYTTTLPTGRVENVEVKRGDNWLPYQAESVSSEHTPNRTVIGFERRGSAILIEVLLNNRLTKKFIVDTGATYTVISYATARELGISPSPSAIKTTLQTANGRVTVPIIKVNSIKVGELEVRNVETALHDWLDTSNEIAGLLGLSFLNKFRVTVDSSQGHLILERNLDSSKESITGNEEDCVTARELIQKGRALNKGSDEEASFYKKALELCKEVPEAHYYLGVVYFKQKKYPSAIIEAQELLKTNSYLPEARYLLAVIYTAQGNYQQAEIELRRVLELDPNHENAKNLLGQILLHK
jgi:clan AA aspartic protease (TIGR02281 family)